MGVPLQTYRQRIGTFRQNISKCYFKNPSKETNKGCSLKPLLLLLILNLILIILTTCYQCDHTGQSSFFSASTQPLPWKPPPATESPPTSRLLGRNHCSINKAVSHSSAPSTWSTPPWITPPWPSSSSQVSSFLYSARSPQVVDVNFYFRYTNGNRRKNGIRMGHINLGSGNLVNKMTNIESIIGGYKPHILGISETCFKKTHDKTDIEIEEYTPHLSKTLENGTLNVSRIAVFTHKDLIVKERQDLMNDYFSSIWLEVGLPRTRKILVCNLYREWQYLDQESNVSLATTAQLRRWLSFMEQWEAAIQNNMEIHVMGDINLDFLKWNAPHQPGSHHRHRLHKLAHALFERIFPFGFAQLVTVATRFWPGQEPSGLDHWYTNKPEKMSNIQVVNQGGSDHRLIFGIRYCKSLISRPRIVKKRCYKDFNTAVFLERVKSISWLNLYMAEDVEAVTDFFTQTMTKILDELAPIKTYQVRKKYAPWLSPNLRKEIKDRDEAQKIAQESGKKEDWNKFKKLRNTVSNKLRGEKIRWQKGRLEEYSSDSRSVWKHVRSWLGWTSGGPPSMLLENGEAKTKPSDISRIMNSFFVTKVQNLRANLPPSDLNSLSKVQNLMQQRSCNFHFRPIHPNEISKIMDILKFWNGWNRHLYYQVG